MSIVLTRAEGPSIDCRKPHTFDTFEDATSLLRTWSSTAPKGGAYDKCDFTVHLPEIDLLYEGTYDLKHWEVEAANLRGHVVDHLKFMSGQHCPFHMSAEKYLHILDEVYHLTPESKAGALVAAQYIETLV